jgi:multidrug transporter EmrE-like cation transporter
MNEPFIALIAVFLNAAAQFAVKQAGTAQAGPGWPAWLSPWLVGAVAMYGVAFILMVRVYAVNPLSVASPVMAGGIFVLISIASVWLLGEAFDLKKAAGIAFILLGIVILSRS